MNCDLKKKFISDNSVVILNSIINIEKTNRKDSCKIAVSIAKELAKELEQEDCAFWKM